MKIVTAAEMTRLDRGASAEYKIPSLLLMENAARGFVDGLERCIGPMAGQAMVVLAGRGNNGGDGLAAARHIRMRGGRVKVYLFSDIEGVVGDARIMLDIWREAGGALFVPGNYPPEQFSDDLSRGSVVIDALLGTGLSHPVGGPYADAIERVNRLARRVVSVDIPSGISADTGEVLGAAMKADYTLTMALPKRGFFLRSGLEHCGKWTVVDIGIPPALIERAGLKVDLIDATLLEGLLRPRTKGSHKGDMGHLLVVGGSVGKGGAPHMSSLAALRCGTGLVTIALPQSLDALGHMAALESMTLPLPETPEGTLSLSGEKSLYEAVEGKSALAVGPGLSQHPETVELVKHLITTMSLPMVIDADGINALATEPAILKRKRGPLMLTPHPGEMGRLVGKTAADIQKDRMTVAAQFAVDYDVILVLKGARTIVATPDGSLRVNNTGNPGMATAGAGDALTGIIGGFLAQGLEARQAAILGVALHGSAGDLAAEAKGEAGLLSSDLIERIPLAIKEQLQGAERSCNLK
ncbi:MAG: NAD(P)H-hydrate dehydratase [Nitrospiria bacterium]